MAVSCARKRVKARLHQVGLLEGGGSSGGRTRSVRAGATRVGDGVGVAGRRRRVAGIGRRTAGAGQATVVRNLVMSLAGTGIAVVVGCTGPIEHRWCSTSGGNHHELTSEGLSAVSSVGSSSSHWRSGARRLHRHPAGGGRNGAVVELEPSARARTWRPHWSMRTSLRGSGQDGLRRRQPVEGTARLRVAGLATRRSSDRRVRPGKWRLQPRRPVHPVGLFPSPCRASTAESRGRRRSRCRRTTPSRSSPRSCRPGNSLRGQSGRAAGPEGLHRRHLRRARTG